MKMYFKKIVSIPGNYLRFSTVCMKNHPPILKSIALTTFSPGYILLIFPKGYILLKRFHYLYLLLPGCDPSCLILFQQSWKICTYESFPKAINQIIRYSPLLF